MTNEKNPPKPGEKPSAKGESIPGSVSNPRHRIRQIGPCDRWSDKARENLDRWGQQDVDTLLLAMQEELGELTQAHLEARAEGGDATRVGLELADLAALCFQLEWLINSQYWSGVEHR